jgi:hypothetical protein
MKVCTRPQEFIMWIKLVHRACEPISGAVGNDFGVRSIAGEAFLAISYRASFWMVHIIGS